ncbi:unnamed protein product [Prorocentrum cordatum]|uniref:Uncharacterized protein n=1 Tax=Prorocentrum cordatum TaxID=2364126 RepID=A0ABN9TKZ8_9DINO|nr:unnamed protein product [Polarella glacialis]
MEIGTTLGMSVKTAAAVTTAATTVAGPQADTGRDARTECSRPLRRQSEIDHVLATARTEIEHRRQRSCDTLVVAARPPVSSRDAAQPCSLANPRGSHRIRAGFRGIRAGHLVLARWGGARLECAARGGPNAAPTTPRGPPRDHV